MITGVLVVGHGSSLEHNRKMVISMAERLEEMNEFGPVVACFMNMNHPTIKEGIEMLASKGVDTIYVQPCFLASGIHLTEDVPNALGLKNGANERVVEIDGKSISLLYCDPIGNDERVAAILADRVREKMRAVTP